jgi:hypothetical protein
MGRLLRRNNGRRMAGTCVVQAALSGTMRENRSFEIVPHPEGWAVKHQDGIAGPYLTKQAAFEAAAGLVENLIAQGYAIQIRVPAEGRPQG